MKKTLIALATLASMTGVATAASVTLYGTVDEGLAYKYNKSPAPRPPTTRTVWTPATSTAPAGA